MSDPLYRLEILRLAADAQGAGRLAQPHRTGMAFNPACGDKVTVDLILEGDRIARLGHETRACVLAQASASILAKTLLGKNRHQIEALRATVTAMLEETGPAPQEPFTAYAAFEGAVSFRQRHRCVLLPIDAVLDAYTRPNQEP